MFASIIGIEGGMGEWLVKHLGALGFEVVGYDERRGDDTRVLAKSDLVVVSVPIGATAGVIKNVAGYMSEGSTLVEIASLKSGVYEALIEASKLGLVTLSIHPMFGPSATSLEDKTIALVPVSEVESEVKRAKHLFPGASIIPTDLETHDRSMSLILSLPYLINIALAGTLKEEDLLLLRRLAGTSFTLQYVLVQSISAEKSGLIHALLSENRFLREYVDRFVDNISLILEALDSNEQFDEVHNDIQMSMRMDKLHGNASEIRQSVYEFIKKV